MAFGKAKPKAAGGFTYQARTSEQVGKRVHQSSSDRVGFIKPEFKVWTAKDGENRVRICPPTWEDAGHCAVDAWVHYDVGPDSNAYLCLRKHNGEADPVCEARMELDAEGDPSAKDLLPRKRAVMWIIDRKDEAAGPQIWAPGWTIDRDIWSIAEDEDTGAVIPIDHPYEGRDVMFVRVNKGKNAPAEFTSFKISANPRPLLGSEEDTNAVLEYITENPVPSTFLFSDYETMAAAFSGGTRPKPAEEGAAAAKPKFGKPAAKTAAAAATPGKPKFGKAAAKPEPEPPVEEEGTELTWDEVHALTEEEVQALAEEREIDFGETEFEDMAAVQDFVCAALEIEAPAEEPELEKPKLKFGKPAAKSTPAAKTAATKPAAKTAAAGPAAKTGSSWKDKIKKFQK